MRLPFALKWLQWGHGAWPWMTAIVAKNRNGPCGLQWGHGAWPWMTFDGISQATGAMLASMGPRRMAVDDL